MKIEDRVRAARCTGEAVDHLVGHRGLPGEFIQPAGEGPKQAHRKAIAIHCHNGIVGTDIELVCDVVPRLLAEGPSFCVVGIEPFGQGNRLRTVIRY